MNANDKGAPRESHAYSTFALDAFWAAGKTGNDPLARHVAECARCAKYLETLAALDQEPAPVYPQAPVVPLRRPLGRSFATIGGSLAVAAAVGLFMVNAIRTNGTDYVGVKGTPSVQLLVHRASGTAIWDGRTAVKGGDAIAIRAACAGLVNVAVALEDTARGRWARISTAPCNADEDVLPFTLVIDGESREERLAVVMSDAPLTDDALDRAARSTERSARTWVVRFNLPEEHP